MRKLLISAFAALALAAAAPAVAGATNPPGSGQPSQECGSAGATSEPAGFNTDGFAHAESVYADGSGHNVSQYDVACFELTSSPHH